MTMEVMLVILAGIAIAGAFFAHAMTETFGGKLLTAAASPDMVSALAIIGRAV